MPNKLMVVLVLLQPLFSLATENADPKVQFICIVHIAQSANSKENGILGAQLGIQDNNSAAKFLQKEFRLENVRVSNEKQITGEVQNLKAKGCSFFVLSVSGDLLKSLMASPAAKGATFINASAADDSLRKNVCYENLYHTALSESMMADAIRLAPKAKSGKSSAVALSWHAGIQRWAAAQLNNRFKKVAKREINHNDYDSWIAVRAIGHTVLNSGASNWTGQNAFLASERFRLSGQKGEPLSFRTWSHQLRQPVVVLDAGKIIYSNLEGEGLDSLGLKRSDIKCERK